MQSENSSKRKILSILLALVVAATVWVYVDEFGNNGGHFLTEKTFTDIPIRYIREDDLTERGLMLLEENTTQTLDVTIQGGRRQVSRLEKDDITITVNLSNVDTAGMQAVDCIFTYNSNKFTNDMSKKPSSTQAIVNISELNCRVVDIRCELSGHVADGYSAGELQLSQNTLEIRGQAEDIDAVSYAKVVLDIGDGAMETVSQNLTFLYFDENGQQLPGDNIHPTVDSVRATLPVYVTKELSLVVDFLESPGAREANLDYEIKPSTIVVSGDAATLNGIDSITLGELDLLELLNSDTSSHTYPIIIPDGCQNLSGVTRATLEISFKDMVSAQIPTQLFTYTNLPAAKHVQILTHELTVQIIGTEEDVAAVTGEQITVTADLTNYSGASGTYTVPAVVEVATRGDIGVVGTYQVQVIIREMAEASPEEPETPDTSENPPGEEIQE